jgi:predicted nucleic acid-binding protein
VTVADAAVVDASAAIRFGFGGAAGLEEVFETERVIAPELFALECANGIRKYVRAGEITQHDGDELLDLLLSLRIELVQDVRVAKAAYGVGLELGLSAYDAAYVVVARGAQARLITADRRLAAAYEHAELIA